MNAAQLTNEEEQAVSKIREEATKKRDHQSKIDQLTKAITNAEESLVEFESKKSFFQERKQQLQAQLTSLWKQKPGDVSLQLGFQPLLAIAESHGTLLAIADVLLDAPRVRKHLEGELAAAKQRLAQFNRQ